MNITLATVAFTFVKLATNVNAEFPELRRQDVPELKMFDGKQGQIVDFERQR